MARRHVSKLKAVVILLFIVTACAAIFFYHYLFSNLSIIEREEVDREMARIHEEIEKELAAELEKLQLSQQKPDTKPDDTPGGKPADDQNQTQPDQKPARPALDEKAVAQIKQAYANVFAKLEVEGNAMIDNLLDDVKEEYKKLGGSKAKIGELVNLASRYTSKAKAKEEAMDKSIESYIGRLKTDLINAGLPEKEIQAYTSEIKKQYKEIKDGRRKQILDAAKKYI